MEVVECAPPYDNAGIASLMACRIISNTPGCLVHAGHFAQDTCGVGSRGDVFMAPSFILVTELTANHPDWPGGAAHVDALSDLLAPQLGSVPVIRLASQPLAAFSPVTCNDSATAPRFDLPRILADEAADGRVVFLIPAMLDIGVLRKAQLAEVAANARQLFPKAVIAYDDVDPCHPLLVEAWTQRMYQRLAASS